MDAPGLVDPTALTAALIRCRSVTPDSGGAFELLTDLLEPLGFAVTRTPRGAVDNLFAVRGDGAPVFGFAGHVDVVPPGDRDSWRVDPFAGEARDGAIWGRGAVDMKSGVAAFVAALSRYIAAGEDAGWGGALALLITGDEEGPAEDGTRAILDWMAERGQRLDYCLVGEPTSVAALGDVIKIGRRGSLTATISARGRQGHTAYPHRALNPLPALARALDRLASAELDAGSEHFEPSTLQLTTIDVGNPASNVIPAKGRATLNIRFNDRHSSASLIEWIEATARDVGNQTGVALTVEASVSGEAFVTEPGALSELVSRAVAAECGAPPELTTGGGTSDARFIRALCPVVEVGLVGLGMHEVDERTPVDQIEGLTNIYHRILRDLSSLG